MKWRPSSYPPGGTDVTSGKPPKGKDAEKKKVGKKEKKNKKGQE